jgi:hypothetical protein
MEGLPPLGAPRLMTSPYLARSSSGILWGGRSLGGAVTLLGAGKKMAAVWSFVTWEGWHVFLSSVVCTPAVSWGEGLRRE